MANLVYFTQNLEAIALDIEGFLCQELKLPIPLFYQILPPERLIETLATVSTPPGPASTDPLCHIYFKETKPRPFELLVTVVPWTLKAFKTPGAFAEVFTYIVPLTRPISGPVKLESNGASFSHFTGDVTTAALLNIERKLTTQAFRLSATSRALGGTVITLPRYLHLEPYDSGSVLILRRAGKPGFFSGVNIGAKDLFAFIPRLEARL